MKRRFYIFLLCAAAAFPGLPGQTSSTEVRAAARTSASTVGNNVSVSASVSAFEAMVPVLHHPRCMNCHMRGDYPRQGDDSHPHIMDVRRGPDGHGASVVKCNTCHQDHNLPGMHMPPGAPDWGLPSPAMPMIWEGRSDRQICLLLTDPQQNGHRTVQQIVEHMHTPLVLWGWSPGEGRTPIPYSEARFLEDVQRWVDHGASCPAE